jgi:hypothetical protein
VSALLNGAALYVVLVVALVSLGPWLHGYVGTAVFLAWLCWAVVGIIRCGARYVLSSGKGLASRIGGALAIIGSLAVVLLSVKDLALLGFL